MQASHGQNQAVLLQLGDTNRRVCAAQQKGVTPYNPAMTSRVVRRFASWIALIAIVAVMFMPTITSALSGHAGIGDVCSADSGRHVPPADGHHTLGHCPYCALHAELTPPPVAAGMAASMVLRFRPLPVAFLRAPRATGVWSTSQPRAPPLFA